MSIGGKEMATFVRVASIRFVRIVMSFMMRSHWKERFVQMDMR